MRSWMEPRDWHSPIVDQGYTHGKANQSRMDGVGEIRDCGSRTSHHHHQALAVLMPN
jgi:hypothetical protein